MINPQTHRAVLDAQKAEITEHLIYRSLARSISNERNRALVSQIADDELRHYHFYKAFSGVDVYPDRIKVLFYVLLARVLGLNFTLKLMEQGEDLAQEHYRQLVAVDPGVRDIVADEERHEAELLAMIDEERMRYTGSVILGLNDALVELTGALAGFTLALQETRLIAASGLIIGVAASLSMAASEYLSTKDEADGRDPLRASLYTGTAYVGVVTVLVAPYFIFTQVFVCLGVTLAVAMTVIAVFNYYVAVAKGLNFRRKFIEMLAISLGVAAVNFGVGFAVKHGLNIDI